MINLSIIPDVNKIDTTRKNANGALIAQMIMFYIGIAAFVLVCMIPPFTLFLPICIPLIVVIVIFVNFAYFGKFMERSSNQMNAYITGVPLESSSSS